MSIALQERAHIIVIYAGRYTIELEGKPEKTSKGGDFLINVASEV